MISNLIVLVSGLIGFVTLPLILKNYKLNSAMNIYMILIIKEQNWFLLLTR